MSVVSGLTDARTAPVQESELAIGMQVWRLMHGPAIRAVYRIIPLGREFKNHMRKTIESGTQLAFGISDYDRRFEQELAAYNDVDHVHDLPEIHAYWAKKYLDPKVRAIGVERLTDLYVNYVFEACRATPDKTVLAVSIGAGNCDLEIEIAEAVLNKGVNNFRIDCLDLNSAMLERGRDHAESRDISDQIGFVEADIKSWLVIDHYEVCIANQSLHHFIDLEVLFEKIRAAIRPGGVFITNDMIGRNGHMRWPEALTVVDRIWSEMPDRYKYNHQLKRFETTYDNWDCSTEGFEGIRAQDILPLLMEYFEFDVFLTFSNLIDIFIDRGFGPNFDPNLEEDRAFIDCVAKLDDEMIDAGQISPTHLVAVMRTEPVKNPIYFKHWTPEFCVRA